MENLDQQIKKNGAISGILLGAISLVITIFLFYFITSMTTSFWMMTIVGPLVFSLLIPLVISILFTFDLRKKIGGFWNFKQATTGVFMMFFVSYLVSFAGSTLFSRVIEPDMTEKMKTAIVGATSSMMEKQGVDQEKIDKNITDMNKKFDEQKDLSVGNIAKSFAMAVIFCFVLSLIFAAFFKKEEPLFLQPTEET